MSPPRHLQYLAFSGLRLGNGVAAHRILASRLLFALFAVALLATESAHQGQLLSSVLLAAGIVLAGMAATGRCWCALYISGYKDEQLVTSGPYSACRNPLYLCTLLGMAGVGLASGTLTLGLAMPAAFLLVTVTTVRREEAFLRDRFGDRFEAYCERTPRFLPRLAPPLVPEWYQVNPRVFHRALRDVIWFPCGVALVHLVAALHEWGLLPSVLRLP